MGIEALPLNNPRQADLPRGSLPTRSALPEPDPRCLVPRWHVGLVDLGRLVRGLVPGEPALDHSRYARGGLQV